MTVWDADTGQPLVTFRAPPGPCLVLSRDGRLLAAGGADGRLRVWATATDRDGFVSPGQGGPIAAVAFSADDLLLAAAGPAGLSVWETATGSLRRTLPASSRHLTGVAFSPDGRRLAAVGFDEEIVRLWDVATGHEVFALRGFLEPRPDEYSYMARVVFSPDGTRIAANNWNGSVNVWDAGEPGTTP